MTHQEDTQLNDVKTSEEILQQWADFRLGLESLEKDLYDCLVKGDYMASRRTKIKLTTFKLEANKLQAELEKFEAKRKQEKTRKK
jgi:hypothetical protein